MPFARLATLLACLALVVLPARAQQADSFDVVIYGGTSSGIAAAIQAARMGKTAVILEPTTHLGGLTTGGLGATDIGNAGSIGGVSREFYQRVLKHYQDPANWKHETPQDYQKRERLMRAGSDAMFGFEPHVATKVCADMLAEVKDKVTVLTGQRLDRAAGVAKNGTRIASIRMESGRSFAGKMFIDATYEGDLMAAAGVSYHVGREANGQYGETLNGVQVKQGKYHQFNVDVDPYVKKGDPASGLLPFIHPGPPGEEGAGDKRVQAYNFRLCMTDVPENRVAWPKPEGYDERDFELLLRQYEAGYTGIPWGPRGMPNRKTDTNNNHGFSSDFIGMNYDYPDGDYATRQKIIKAHEKYQKGLMWTLANHPRVPEKVREAVGKWGLARDEFVENGHWPTQIYVREARRMVSAYVVTENDVWGKRAAEDPVGLGSYGMDSHHVQRYVDARGFARNEGDVQVHGFPPYGISYRAIVPKAEQCTNLLVPVCVSATHICYGSIRMEPVFMILGQSAATAAALCIDDNLDVQKLPYDKLKARLVADKQIVEWTGPRSSTPPGNVIELAKLPGVAMDDQKARLTGEWGKGSFRTGVEAGYQHNGNEGKGQKTARFELTVPADGMYEVRFAYVPNPNRASNVPVTVESAEGNKTVKVDQKKVPPIDKAFISLGTFKFTRDKPAVVTVSNEGTAGHVTIDGVQLVPAK